ncbi:hypothetical protein LOTGIDRAFT_181575, partial [Lottia gigantea]
MEDHFVCPICIEFAEDAVETTCCHNIYCHACITSIHKDECPTCRASKPKYKFEVSHLARRLIGGMEMTCPFGCGTVVPRSEKKGHELTCINKPYHCPAMGCEFQGVREAFLQHMITEHASTILKNVDQLFEGAPLEAAEVEIDRIKTTVNFKKAYARLGETGKYYCSKALDGPRCTCCNGNCGPTNGCNCSSCMKLDVYVRKLPNNWFVNRDGAACRKGVT